jgi:NAD-dependent dihydropyrimidine dehydrogenase PreA subunit
MVLSISTRYLPIILSNLQRSKTFKHDEKRIIQKQVKLNLPTVIVDLDICEGVGVCAEVCPMNVFDMVEVEEAKKASPARMDDCILCLACVSACPTQAITVED